MIAATLALTVVFAIATWAAGWWAVLVVALVTGAAWRRAHGARLCALSATLAWVLLLAVDARGGRLGAVSGTLGGTMRLPPVALLIATLLLAAIGAWSAAVVGDAVRGVIDMKRG